MSHPQCDIILPVHDALDYTQNCVETLFQHTRDFRLIIVDDYSNVETTAYLMGLLHRQPYALYVRTGQQKWWTRAVNIGARLLRTNWSAAINSDCVFRPNWLDEMFEVRDEAAQQISFRKVGLVGSVLAESESRRWAETRHPGYTTGHCILFDVHAFDEMATKRGCAGWYLDETKQYTAHIHSDKEICYELNESGYGTIQSFKSAVGHHGGRSWGHDLTKTGRIRLGDFLKGEVFSS